MNRIPMIELGKEYVCHDNPNEVVTITGFLYRGCPNACVVFRDSENSTQNMRLSSFENTFKEAHNGH